MQGASLSALQSGQSAVVEIEYEAQSEISAPRFLVGIKDNLGRGVAFLDSLVAGELPSHLPQKGTVTCHIERLPLLPGNYPVNLAVMHIGQLSDHIMNAIEIPVVEGDYFGTGRLDLAGSAACFVMHRWSYLASDVDTGL
jgi:hypothetical protein